MRTGAKEVANVTKTRLKRDLIEDGLNQALSDLRPAAKVAAQWAFVPCVRGVDHGTASLEEDWLVLSVPVSSRSHVRASFRREGHWSLAIQNGGLGGGSKLRVVDNRHSLHLRNEIWVGNERRAAAMIDSGCRLFREGISTLVNRPDEKRPDPSGDAVVPPPESVACLQDMAAAEGWNLEERDSGDLVHNLDLGNRGAYQIRLRPEPDGHLRAWSAVLPEQELEPVSRRALGVLLARANDQLRLVRGAVYQNGGKDSVHFEVVQRVPFCPEQIKLMLSSLTAACWKCGPEIRLLTGRNVAQRYLESFGVAQMVIPG